MTAEAGTLIVTKVGAEGRHTSKLATLLRSNRDVSFEVSTSLSDASSMNSCNPFQIVCQLQPIDDRTRQGFERHPISKVQGHIKPAWRSMTVAPASLTWLPILRQAQADTSALPCHEHRDSERLHLEPVRNPDESAKGDEGSSCRDEIHGLSSTTSSRNPMPV